MDWITKLFDIGKLPSKILAWICLLSAFLLFCPQRIAKAVHVEAIPANISLYIGLAFVGSASLLAINLILWIWSFIHRKVSHRIWTVRLVEVLAQLDPAELAVLREFYIQEANSLKMPVDDPTVAGLRDKGVLVSVGQLGEASIAGMLFPLAISQSAKRLITGEWLGLPNREPTQEERRRIIEARPAFVKKLNELSWLRRW